jgi:hypothetical protein
MLLSPGLRCDLVGKSADPFLTYDSLRRASAANRNLGAVRYSEILLLLKIVLPPPVFATTESDNRPRLLGKRQRNYAALGIAT